MKKIMNLIILMYLLGIVFIVPIDINNTTIYSGTIINSIFIIVIIFKLPQFKFTNIEKILSVLVFLYCITSMLNLFFMEEKYIFYTINKLIPLVSLVLLIGYSNSNNIDINRIFRYLLVFMSLIIVGSFIMYIIGYSGIKIINGRITLLSNQYYIDMFGEPRMSWLFTHKSRFAIVCFINIGLLMINREINKIVKDLLIIISLVDIYYSSTKTILYISLVVVAIYYFKEKFKTKRDKYLKYSIGTFLLVIIMIIIPKVINALSTTRQLFSLGGRAYLWEAGVKKALENLNGIGRFSEINWLRTEKLYGGVYTNAHNMFINEIIERGILPGIIFIFIFVLLAIMMKNKISKCVILGCIASAMMDNTLTSEISYIFWIIMFIYYKYDNQYITRKN